MLMLLKVVNILKHEMNIKVSKHRIQIRFLVCLAIKISGINILILMVNALTFLISSMALSL